MGKRLLVIGARSAVLSGEPPGPMGQAWGLPTIPSFHKHGTPPVEESDAAPNA